MQGTISTMRCYMVQCSDNVVNIHLHFGYLTAVDKGFAVQKIWNLSKPQAVHHERPEGLDAKKSYWNYSKKNHKIILVFVFLVLLLFGWFCSNCPAAPAATACRSQRGIAFAAVVGNATDAWYASCGACCPSKIWEFGRKTMFNEFCIWRPHGSIAVVFGMV